MWSATFGWLPRHRSASSEASLSAVPLLGVANTPRARTPQGGRFPCRRAFERRLKALLPETLPGRIGCPGHHLLALEHEQDLRVGLKAFLKAG
jgi:hypothetical protein